MRINVNGKVQYYKQQSGVVIDEKFLTYEEFKEAFKKLLLDSEGYKNLRYNINQAQKIVHIIEGPTGPRTTTEYLTDIHKISEEFSKFMGGLGGNISLLTTFSFGKRTQRSYYLANEKSLPSQENVQGKKVYENTRQAIKNLENQAEKLALLDKTFKKHLIEFSNQLHDPKAYSKDNFISLRKWSYYNLNKRWYEYGHGTMHSISYCDYFWGKSLQVHGYIAEAYGTHLAFIHPDALMGQHINQLKKSVISEHGGFGDYGLFELLASTKGNINSQISGDTVIIDKTGRVQFNIQSKASTKTKYKIEITYKQFLEKMDLFLSIYEKYVDNIDNIADEDVAILFQAFKTEAWIPISEDLEENVDFYVDDLIESTF